MKTIKTTLVTEAVFSEDGLKRYMLRKIWDEKKPKLAIIMLAPSGASGIELDNSTQLVLNNAYRLGYGSVDILNLFATLNDFMLKSTEDDDGDNMKAILKSAKDADAIVYAAGVGKTKNKTFQQRQKTVIAELKRYENKLHCLCSENGEARFQHPLSPAVRTWFLSPFKTDELIGNLTIATTANVENSQQ
ncbi:MAG: DUF1643 domain-containing protein [Clostridia bacterium]|nr:DUF1643 domain-containing protein [Clostridia bacterium]